MSSSSEQIDDQQKTHRMMKKFMTNKVKGLKEKMSELVASSNCQKMKSWSENSKLEVVHALRKFKGMKIEKKKKNHEETDQKYDETTTRVSSSMKEEEEEEEEELMLSNDSMRKRLYELGEKLEKTMERVGVIETVLERELVRRCSSTVKDEEEHMSDSDETDDDDESESGYCTPDPDSRV